MKTISLIAALLLAVTEISMLGIKIGSPESALKKLSLEEVAREDGMVKYRTANGNDFSVTTENGKVVFMENDWLQDPAGKASLLPGFTFGETTLKDIRKRFGTNGFTYKMAAGGATDTHVIQLNCFETDSPGGEVLVIVTKVPLDADVDEGNVAEHLKLDAIIVAGQEYLDNIWGNEKVYDPNRKKVRL